MCFLYTLCESVYVVYCPVIVEKTHQRGVPDYFLIYVYMDFSLQDFPSVFLISFHNFSSTSIARVSSQKFSEIFVEYHNIGMSLSGRPRKVREIG